MHGQAFGTCRCGVQDHPGVATPPRPGQVRRAEDRGTSFVEPTSDQKRRSRRRSLHPSLCRSPDVDLLVVNRRRNSIGESPKRWDRRPCRRHRRRRRRCGARRGRRARVDAAACDRGRQLRRARCQNRCHYESEPDVRLHAQSACANVTRQAVTVNRQGPTTGGPARSGGTGRCCGGPKLSRSMVRRAFRGGGGIKTD